MAVSAGKKRHGRDGRSQNLLQFIAQFIPFLHRPQEARLIRRAAVAPSRHRVRRAPRKRMKRRRQKRGTATKHPLEIQTPGGTSLRDGKLMPAHQQKASAREKRGESEQTLNVDFVDEQRLRRAVEEEGFLEFVGGKKGGKGKRSGEIPDSSKSPGPVEKGSPEKSQVRDGKKKKKEKDVETPEPEELKHTFRIPKPVKSSGLRAFIAAIGFIGLGKERTAFIDNLATMMDAGLPLLDALHSLQDEARHKPMRRLIGNTIAAVETGSPLWRAMEEQCFFKPQEIAMVRVGEEAGNLVENLQYLAEQEEKDRHLRGKVQTAMIYPIIVLVMLTVIVFGLGLFILPNLIGVLKSLGADLPLTTRIIIAATELLSGNAGIIVPSFFGGVIVLVILAKFTPLKIVVQWMLLKTPGIGPLIREATISRFGVVMGGLLKAGVPVTDSLRSLVGVTGLTRYHSFYVQLLEHVELGDSFSTSFGKIRSTKRCFPPSVQQLIMTGEKSGSLTKVMLKIADIHEKSAAGIAEKLPVIIEPLLLLFVGGLVAAIALGVLAPIYSVVGSIGNA